MNALTLGGMVAIMLAIDWSFALLALSITPVLAIIDATVKCPIPEVSLPERAMMEHVLARWSEFGLPPIVPRQRLARLLATHSQAGS